MKRKTIWDLSLEIAGKDKGASAALKTVKKQVENVQAAGKQLGKDFKEFAANAGKLALGVAGGVAAATAGVVALANTFAETGDKVAKTSERLGIGIEAYQGLSYAMQQSGLSAEEFDGALEKFNLTVRQGAAGNETARKQLEEIGLSAQKLAGMKPEHAMERLSEYMKSLPNDAERTRVAVTLFGKAAGPKMMAAMKQGKDGIQNLMKEAKSLGIVLTEEQAHQSEAYRSAQTRLMQSVTGMKNQFISGAIGPLTEAFDHLKNAVVEQMPDIQELGKKFGQWLGDLVKRLPEIIAKIKELGTWVKDTVNKVKDFVGGWGNLGKILATLVIAPTLISGIKTLSSTVNFLYRSFDSVKNIARKVFGAISDGALNGVIAIGKQTAALVAQNAVWLAQKVAILAQAAAQGVVKVATMAWTGVQWLLNVAMTANPIGVIIMAIAALIAGIIALIANWDDVKEAVGKVWDWICEKISAAVDFIVGIWEGIVDFFSGIWDGIKDIASSAWDGIKGVFSTVGGFFEDVWDGVKDLASEAWDGITDVASSAWDGIKNAAQYHPLVIGFNKIKEYGPAAFEKVKEVAGNVFDKVKNIASGALEKIKEKFPGLAEKGQKVFSALKAAAGGDFSKIKEIGAGAIDKLKNGFSSFKNFASEKLGFIGDFFSGIFDKIKAAFQSVIDFFQAGIEKIKGFFSGIKDAVGGFFSGIGDFFGGLFGNNKNNDVAKHAAGGIFTHRHIAEIAERGAEAVIPLNNSKQGLDIWKQAGAMGGYFQNEKAETGTPPVMFAAGKMSGGENVFNFEIKLTNNFNGGTPDSNVARQIDIAGKQSADNFTDRVKAVLEDLLRQQRRVSYA